MEVIGCTIWKVLSALAVSRLGIAWVVEKVAAPRGIWA